MKMFIMLSAVSLVACSSPGQTIVEKIVEEEGTGGSSSTNPDVDGGHDAGADVPVNEPGTVFTVPCKFVTPCPVSKYVSDCTVAIQLFTGWSKYDIEANVWFIAPDGTLNPVNGEVPEGTQGFEVDGGYELSGGLVEDGQLTMSCPQQCTSTFGVADAGSCDPAPPESVELYVK